MTNDTSPAENEYLAAIGGIHEQTISVRMFAPGMQVRCLKAFANGYQTGEIVDRVTDRSWGECYRVDTREGRLLFKADELELL